MIMICFSIVPAIFPRWIGVIFSFLSLTVSCVAFLPAYAQQVAPPKRLPVNQAEVELSYAPLVREVSPSVVNVYTKKTVRRGGVYRDMFGRLFSSGPARSERVHNSLGSGVIVSADGVVVTNNHLIEGADEFLVVLSDRREYPAEVILTDERTDLAVLRIDTGDVPLSPMTFADTRRVEVGDFVLAIGNPFGVGQTVTTGIISATARTDVGISDYAFFLQTDAAVNPGNSGGALINTRGELVGVNTAIFSRSGGSNGIGFSIPAEMVKRVVEAAINEGVIVRPWLGLKGQPVTFDIARAQGLASPVGIIVTEIHVDSPVAKAGLRRGDLILKIDDREVYDERGLNFLAATKSPGTEARLGILRGGKEQVIPIKLEALPGAGETTFVLLNGRHPFSGVEVAELSPWLAEQNGLDPFATGVLVNHIRANAVRHQVTQPGDIIISVNGKMINTLADLENALDYNGRRWAIEIDRNGRRISGYVTL